MQAEVLSFRAPADLADGVHSFAVDAGLSRTGALLMLVALGLRSGRSREAQSVMASRSRERTRR